MHTLVKPKPDSYCGGSSERSSERNCAPGGSAAGSCLRGKGAYVGHDVLVPWRVQHQITVPLADRACAILGATVQVRVCVSIVSLARSCKPLDGGTEQGRRTLKMYARFGHAAREAIQI
jgi:hypothetical protein